MNKPIITVKSGSILLSLWNNEAMINGEKMMLPNITITRCYMGKKGWQQGHQFRPKDLENILDVIDRFHKEQNKKEH